MTDETVDRAALVTQIAWLDQIKAVAAARAGELRAQLAAEARAEHKRHHGMGVSWKWEDLATVVLPLSQQAVVVRDPVMFTRWVKERYPAAIETLEQVRPSWLEQFLLDCRVAPGEDGPPEPYDPTTGEVKIPGLAVRPGGEPMTLTVTVKPAAKRLFAELAEQELDRFALAARPAEAMVSGAVPLGLPEVGDG